MLAKNTGLSVLLFILYLGMACHPRVYGRVLVRRTTSTLLPYDPIPDNDQLTPKLLDRSNHNLVTPDIATPGHSEIYQDILSYLSTKRLHRRTGKQPAPATDDVFSTSMAKGCSMLYMMAVNADDAVTRPKTNPSLSKLASSQSTWDKAEALKQYGWSERKDSVNWAYMGVNDVMKELGIDTTSKDNMNIQLVQDTAVTVDGTSYAVSESITLSSPSPHLTLTHTHSQASDGTYDQAINPSAGLIIPYYIFSPRHEAQTNNVPGPTVPFAQYSDVLFLEYAKLCGRAKPQADVKNLRYMMFLNIENPNTWSVALKALMNKNGGKKDIPLWPGTKFGMNEVEGRALLGTQIGAPVGWMLVQRKRALGVKSVVKVGDAPSVYSFLMGDGLLTLSAGENFPKHGHDESGYRSAVPEFVVLYS
jgi:hypothetical protein